MRFLICLFVLLAPVIPVAQPVSNVRPGTAQYKAIMASARKSFGNPEPFKTGPIIDAVRMAGEWAFVFDRLEGGDAKSGAVEWACLLVKRHGKWRVRSAKIGLNARKIVMAEKYSVPKDLFNVPGPRIN